MMVGNQAATDTRRAGRTVLDSVAVRVVVELGADKAGMAVSEAAGNQRMGHSCATVPIATIRNWKMMKSKRKLTESCCKWLASVACWAEAAAS